MDGKFPEDYMWRCARPRSSSSWKRTAQAQSALTHHVRQEVIERSGAVPEPPTRYRSPCASTLFCRCATRQGWISSCRTSYDPSSPSYRHFLTVSEFTARFGPSQEDYDALTQLRESNGLQVVGGSRDGMDVQVEGPVAAIETAFNVSMGVYQHPTENRTFYAPDREPTVDLPFPLWHISGLDNYSIPHPMLVRKSDYAKARGIDPEAVVPMPPPAPALRPLSWAATCGRPTTAERP